MNRIMRLFDQMELDKDTKEKVANVRAVIIDAATMLDAMLPEGAEKTVTLRGMLDAKEAAVRSVIFDTPR